MKLKECVYEETYGGSHISTVDVSTMMDKFIIYQRPSDFGMETIIDATPFNHVKKSDFKIIQINREEFELLKNKSLNHIRKSIELLNRKINDICSGFELDKEVEVLISTNQTSEYFNPSRTKYSFGYEEFKDTWRTQVVLRMSLKELLMKNIIHINNHHHDDYGFISYKIKVNKEIRDFFKNEKWESPIWNIHYYNTQLKYFENKLKKVEEIDYTDI